MPTRKKSASKLKNASRFNMPLAGWLASITVMVGLFVVLFSRAAGSGTLYLDPLSAEVLANSTVTLTVRADSGSIPVNAVRADLKYPNGTLEFVGIDVVGSSYGVEAPTKTSNNTVSITRGSITPLTGDHLVAKVTFKLISGSANKVTLANTSVLASASSNANIIDSLQSATLGVLSGNSPTATPTANGTTTPVATATPAKAGTTPTPLFGTRTATPSVSPTPIPGAKTKVTVDGKAVTGENVDTSKLSDGNHTVTTTTTDSTGAVVKETTSTLKVNTNKSFWQNAVLIAGENVVAVGLIVFLAIVAVVAFLLYRRHATQSANPLAWPS